MQDLFASNQWEIMRCLKILTLAVQHVIALLSDVRIICVRVSDSLVSRGRGEGFGHVPEVKLIPQPMQHKRWGTVEVLSLLSESGIGRVEKSRPVFRQCFSFSDSDGSRGESVTSAQCSKHNPKRMLSKQASMQEAPLVQRHRPEAIGLRLPA
jgi:hypothetical protein